jgi:hypothetical protein
MSLDMYELLLGSIVGVDCCAFYHPKHNTNMGTTTKCGPVGYIEPDSHQPAIHWKPITCQF